MNWKNIFSLQALRVPVLMLVFMWLGFFLQQVGFFSNCWGSLIPLAPAGLKGILFSPFLHGSLEHLTGNSLPIFLLTFLLYQFYEPIANKIFLSGWLLSGLLVWLLPPINLFSEAQYYSCIIGASGIVYVLAFFLFFSGVFRWNMKLLTVSLAVAFYYGSLIWGVLPEELFSKLPEPSRISWQSHLAGALIGIVLAYFFRDQGEKKNKFIWQFPNYYSERDDLLWQEYKENHPEDFLELPHREQASEWEHLDEILKK